jgi:hypothetical protein
MPRIPDALLPILIVFCAMARANASPPNLKPLMAVPDKVVAEEDFSRTKPLSKDVWQARQGTRWAIEDGVLRGLPSPPEYQAAKKDHKGTEARISLPACPQEYVIRFSVRFLGGEPTAIIPFVEFGHHCVRVAWAGGGAKVLADSESVVVNEAPKFKVEPGKWMHGLAEMKGDELVIQFADGPTLYAKHERFAAEKDGFGLAGTKGGTVELDDVTVWSVKPDEQSGWRVKRAGFPKFEPVPVEKAQGKKAVE